MTCLADRRTQNCSEIVSSKVSWSCARTAQVETKAEKGSDVAEAPLQAAKEADRYDQAAKEADKDDHTGGPAVEREGNQDRQAEGSKGLWASWIRT